MIVVTAPTGQIGSQVLDQLVQRGEQVRVVVRDPGRLTEPLQGQVEAVRGSHRDADVVKEAFDGADAVFWLVPPDPSADSIEDAYVGFSQAAADALAGSGIGRVVNISALGRGTPVADRAGFVTGSLAVDDLLSATGVSFRAVVNPSFMDNLLRQAQFIAEQDVFTSPVSGDLLAPTAAVRDIATTAVRLLIDGSWGGSAEAPVLGPEDLSQQDLAAIMSDVLGREVRFQHITFDALEERMRGAGMSEAMAAGYVAMMRAKDDGLDNGVRRTPERSTPISFRSWCAEVLAPAVTS